MLRIDGVSKAFGELHALSDFSCNVDPGEITGLLGPNGAGKSTLFNVVSGCLEADAGAIYFNDCLLNGRSPHRTARLGIGRTFQNVRLISRFSVMENVLLAFPDQPGEKLRHLLFKPALCRRIENRNRSRASELLALANLDSLQSVPASDISYGQQKLLNIICCLAGGADLLLLDEPVAGINPALVEVMGNLIAELPKQGKSVLLIEHNVDFIMKFSDRVIFMDAGRKVCEGPAETVRSDPRVIDAYLG